MCNGGGNTFSSMGSWSIHRDIKDTTVGTLSQRITNQVHGLKGLNSKLLDIRSYLERVVAGKLPINHPIIYHLQDVFNLLPDVNLLVRYCWCSPWQVCKASGQIVLLCQHPNSCIHLNEISHILLPKLSTGFNTAWGLASVIAISNYLDGLTHGWACFIQSFWVMIIFNGVKMQYKCTWGGNKC